MLKNTNSIHVLIAPQHWGLGHITRTIPIIRYFVSRKYKVTLACSGAGMDLLKIEFPELPLHELPDYNMKYPKSNMYWNIGIQIFKLHLAIFKERRAIKKLHNLYCFDLIVSDSRLGAAIPGVKSVIISHHLRIPLSIPFFEIFSDLWMRFFYMQFHQIWIPDFEGEINISGKLAHRFSSNKHYFLGPISRFKKLNIPKKYDVAFILSGPEPQRTYFEELICSQLHEISHLKVILVRGTSVNEIKHELKDIEIIQLAGSTELNEIMCGSDMIVCRSGYTSLLDLAFIQKKALLVATPGQPEQEYLGKELFRKNLFLHVDQKNFNLKQDLLKATLYPGFGDEMHSDDLHYILDKLISKLNIINQ